MPLKEESIITGEDQILNLHTMSQCKEPVEKVSVIIEVTEHQLPVTLLGDSPAESSWDKMSSSNQSSQVADVPIAICGMAMRLPGGISSEDEFWDFLVNKKDARCRIPADRYNIDAFHSNTAKSGAIKTTHGYFLDHVDLAHFDASFFSMTKSELEKLDPQHRLLLEVTRECLENAGEMNWRGKDIGCYIGVFGEDWLDLHAKDTQDSGMYRITGYGDFLLGNRVSYEYDFKGPSVTIKTGCSSSLICLHMACEALKARQISSAIVVTQAMFEQGVLSPNGSCRTFDADANGYARGEAINALYVKRLDDALANGDPIRAVIRATASNCDGKTPGIAHPSSESHEALIRSCYESAGLYDYSQTGFVECHGTGTATGDPLEATAVANVFGEKGVYIGSVKPNLGHSEGASGLTSVIKSVLALENKTIPPNIKFTNPNPKIPFRQGRLTVPIESTPWPEDRVERVSVNSFGIGGANAHIILDSANSFGIGRGMHEPIQAIPNSKQRLVVFTANNAESVRKGSKYLQEYIAQYPRSLQDAAYTLAVRRQHLPYRSFAVANADTANPLLEFVAPSKTPTVTPNVTFVFTGQGAQWPTMGAKLCSEFPSAVDDFKRMDKVLAELETAPSWTIFDELAKSKNVSRLDQAEFSQPLCTAVQIVLVNILRTLGIQPTAVVGHSSGEIAAAYCSGALSFVEAITSAYLRGLVTKKQTREGAMAAVGMGRSAVQGYLTDRVAIACENSPESTTLSGDEDQIDGILSKIKIDLPDVFARRLKVEMAYHSYHMREIGAEYEQLLMPHISSCATDIPFYSSVSNKVITKKSSLDAAYWRANLESPVLFSTAIEKLLTAQPGKNLFLEIGPHSALAGPLRQILKANGQSDATYIPTLVRGQDDVTSILTAAGQLFLKAIPLNFDTLNPNGKLLTNLPNYPWHHDTRYWHESRLSKEWRLRSFPRHDVLGSQVVECSKLEPIWRNILRLDDVPWCRDHLIAQDTVFPGAGYIAMAGEAIRQVSGQEDYSLRHMTISSAMILHEGTATETTFALRPLRLTTSLDSLWYEFSVSSFNGTTWTKHCAGQVRAGASIEGTENDQVVPEIVDLPRKVQSAHWYSTMRAVGLNYGPRFQGLDSISAHPLENRAVAHVSNDFDMEKESVYQLHPTTIDLCIQLFSTAASKGQARSFGSMSVPTYFGEISVHAPSGQMTVEVCAEVSAKGAILGHGVAVAEDQVVLKMKDVRLSPLDDDDGSAADCNPHAGVRLVWKADVTFATTADLMSTAKAVREPYPVVQTLILLCAIETRNRLASIDTTQLPPHIHKFSAWIDSQLETAQAEGYPFVDNASALFGLTTAAREALLIETAAQVQETEAANVGTAVTRIFENIQTIAISATEPLDLLLKDEVLTKLYDFANGWDYKPLLHLLSHSKPHMRILEIGAGTGATTAVVLGGLVSEFGERMFQSYTYTDISAGFFAAAKERFKNFQGIEYLPLDISRDPADQGLDLGSFDLIIATNVLHATPSLNETLVNVRKLLQPNGKLLLQELCTQTKWINYIMGVLPGWWLGDGDSRSDEPYVQPERWTQELETAGFSTPEAIILDDEMPYTTNATIIASPKAILETIKEPVSILARYPDGPIAQALATVLASRGLKVDFVSLADIPSNDTIAILDIEGPSFVADISETNYALFKVFIAKLTSAKMLWLTKPCQIRSHEPAYAQIIGLARTIRNELSIDFATLELDNLEPCTWNSVADVLGKYRLQTARKEGDYDPEYEYVLSDGVVHIPRFHWTSVVDELANSGAANDESKETPKRLEIGKRGSLKTLRWVERPQIALEGDEVAVEIRAVGMNFKDILIAMGVVDGNKSEGNGLGCECSGVIRSIGPGVENLAVGDRVVVFAGNSYSTILKTSAQLCAKMPDNLSFADGATMPCVYGTVIHGLLDLSGLRAGQSVLIHSACGGIGIAAIQIAKMVAAEIFATVGNEEKIKYLVDKFQIPRERIFNSRNTSFLPNLMQATDGKGVDVVLNSLSGDLLHASWQCVAQFGKMVEIGKRDFIGQGRLAMDLFEANRCFFGVDLAQICADRPSMIKKLLGDCMAFYSQGLIQPIRPIKYFDAVQIEDAFRFMQRGQHIGKIVVRIPEHHADLQTAKIHTGFALRYDASYLLVGGLGGLGRSVSRWMVDHGARHLTYLSRSGGTGVHDEALVTELAAAGCAVQIIAGSVTNLADVRKVTAQATMPIAGVVQMSMVLRDGGFPQMTHEDWMDVASPKVQGTWNLHETFKDHALDFFLLFSSFSGLVGQWGQANYASANTFLDAFVQFRHAAGLPASVLDIGAMADVGYVSQNAGVMEQFRATAVHILREQDLLDALTLSIQQQSQPVFRGKLLDGYVSNSQLGIGLKMTQPIAAANNRSIWKRDVRMSLYRNLETAADDGTAGHNDELKEFMAAVSENPRVLAEDSSVAVLAMQIGSTLFSFMMKPLEELDVKLSPSALGMDSLVAIELRNWCRQRLGLEVSVLEIMGAPSIEKLSRFVAEGLMVKLGLGVRDGETFLLMKAP